MERATTRLDLAINYGCSSLRRSARRYGIPVYETSDINSEAALSYMDRLKPDLIVSVYASQIFKAGLLSLPGRGCVNIHPSLLPAYAGIAPVFWALSEGENETGVTIHSMTTEVDAGSVIEQERINISAADTVRSVYKKLSILGSWMLCRVLDRFETGPVPVFEQEATGRRYFGQPNKQAFKKLLARGRRLF